MKRILFIVIIVIPLHIQAQEGFKKFEVQFYSAPLGFFEYIYDSDGPREFFGPSVEFYFNEQYSLTFNATWNGKEIQLSQVIQDPISGDINGYDYDLAEKNRIYNLFLKKYSTSGLYYGLYFRYWHYLSERLNTDSYSDSYKNYFNYYRMPVTYSNHKITLGGVLGYKRLIGEHISIAGNCGLGLSLPFMYLSNEKFLDENLNGLTKYSDEAFPLEHLNIMSRLILGFRF